MGFFDEGRTIIRVAVNELQDRAVNPHIPYGPEEVAEASIAAARAGASIVHFHSRTATGAQALADDAAGADIYRRALELTASSSDVLMEPTNMPLGGDPSLAADTPHFWSLVEQPPAHGRLEVVNIDGFRFAHGRVAWTHAHGLRPVENRRIVTDAAVVAPEVIRRTLEHGLVPVYGVFELSDVRVLAHYARLGLTPQPVVIQINLFGDLMKGPTPGVAAIDAFLAEWPADLDHETCVFFRGMPDRASYEALVDAALARGVHVRVGLGDNPHLFPRGTTADMVEHLQERLDRRGLRAVTPAELRARIGVAPRDGQAVVATPAATSASISPAE